MFSIRLRSRPSLLHPRKRQITAPSSRAAEVMECSPGLQHATLAAFLARRLDLHYFCPFAPFVFLGGVHFLTSSPGPLHLSGRATAPPVQMVEEYKVRSGSRCNPCTMEKLSGLQPLRIHSVRASQIHQRLQSRLPVSVY